LVAAAGLTLIILDVSSPLLRGYKNYTACGTFYQGECHVGRRKQSTYKSFISST
jgi:hypothetical protein